MTNFERIKNMTVEEMASNLIIVNEFKVNGEITDGYICSDGKMFIVKNGECGHCSYIAVIHELNWLNSESEV